MKDNYSKQKKNGGMALKQFARMGFPVIPFRRRARILKNWQVGSKMEGKRIKRKIGEMCVIIRFELKKAFKQITDDIDSQFQKITMKSFNDSDKVYLLKVYREMLSESSKRWNIILDIVYELRTEEIEANSWGMAKSEEPLAQEKLDKLIPLKLKEIESLVLKAFRIYNQDINEEAMSPVPKPSLDEIERVMKIIEEMELERKKAQAIQTLGM